MNRSEVAQAMAAASGLPKQTAERALSAALAAMARQLAVGERITLAGFGTLRPVARRARTGRDPRTGSKIYIAPRTSVQFVLSPELLSTLNSTASAVTPAPVAAAARVGQA